MKKTVLLILLLSVGYSYVLSQKGKMKLRVDVQLFDVFFNSHDSIYNPLTMVFTDENGKVHYDNVPDSSKYLIESNCMVNGEADRKLRFANAHIKNDTLYISIYEGNAADETVINLRIFNNQLSADYTYATPVTGKLRTGVNACEVTLNSKFYRKNDWVKGKIKLTGICNDKYCRENKCAIEGYFKCTVE